MKAFDLDGVFIPDAKIFNDQYLQVRNTNMRPIFEPKGSYAIITGRPIQDQYDTQEWINDVFINPPQKIYIGVSNNDFMDIDKVSFYKANILNMQKNITTFYESDINQKKLIDKYKERNVKVIHWGSFLKGKI